MTRWWAAEPPTAWIASPPLGPRTWASLCAASLLGANLGDLVAHDLHLGHWQGVPALLALLAVSLRADVRTRLPARPFFWISVVLVRTVATNLADLATHDLHLRNAALAALLAAGLVASAWGTHPARADRRFWITLFLAGTLGTVLGDDASHGWGLQAASLLLSGLLALALAVAARTGVRGPARYWSLVLLARTSGTSIADLCADRSGLGLAGSTLCMALLMAATLHAGRTASRAARPAS